MRTRLWCPCQGISIARTETKGSMGKSSNGVRCLEICYETCESLLRKHPTADTHLLREMDSICRCHVICEEKWTEAENNCKWVGRKTATFLFLIPVHSLLSTVWTPFNSFLVSSLFCTFTFCTCDPFREKRREREWEREKERKRWSRSWRAFMRGKVSWGEGKYHKKSPLCSNRRTLTFHFQKSRHFRGHSNGQFCSKLL